MSRESNGSWWLLLAGWLSLLIIWSTDYLQAPAADVKAVVALAEGNPEAQTIVKAFLGKHPVPNEGELRRLRIDVNEQISLGIARNVTGDTTLKSPSAQDLEDEATRATAEQQERLRVYSLPISAMTYRDALVLLTFKIVDHLKLIAIIGVIIGFAVGVMRWKTQ